MANLKVLCTLVFLSILSTYSICLAQNNFADSIRLKYSIPELAYAVVSSQSVYEMQVLGTQKINSNRKAKPSDRFRIGSNTKAITGFIAAQLVKQKKLKWDTKFFDLFPELKTSSDPAHHELTLLNLLSFRTRLFPYTYTYSEPKVEQFTGSAREQRYQFTKWFFAQPPVNDDGDRHFSNLGYTAAGLMLEKVTGKSYETLVEEFGKQLDIKFGFGSPNARDTLQPWGHDSNFNPEIPSENYKLNWLMAAGNINASLPDYLKFIQVQLSGMKGKSTLLSAEEFRFLHFGLPWFSVGWFSSEDDNHEPFSYNIGNPGTFLSKVFVFPDRDIAYVFLTNAQTTDSDNGINILYDTLRKKYKPGKQ